MYLMLTWSLLHCITQPQATFLDLSQPQFKVLSMRKTFKKKKKIPPHLFIETARSTDLSRSAEQKQRQKTAVLDKPLSTSTVKAQQQQAPAVLLHGNRSRLMDLYSPLTCTSLQRPGNWVSSSSSRWANSPLVCLSGKSAFQLLMARCDRSATPVKTGNRSLLIQPCETKATRDYHQSLKWWNCEKC